MLPILLLLLLLAAITLIAIYNSLVRRRNAVDNAFHSMDAMLMKRYDLIPQLVDTVRGYMQHERDLLERLTRLREEAQSDFFTGNDKVGIDNAISESIQTLYVRVENYPRLKASENFLHLQRSINESEEQLAASRRFYNSAVNAFHNGLDQFPSSMVASWAGMKHRYYFSVPDSERQVPAVQFNRRDVS